jgi:hypothetical protein
VRLLGAGDSERMIIDTAPVMGRYGDLLPVPRCRPAFDILTAQVPS